MRVTGTELGSIRLSRGDHARLRRAASQGPSLVGSLFWKHWYWTGPSSAHTHPHWAFTTDEGTHAQWHMFPSLGVGVAEETARVVPAGVSVVIGVPKRRGENAERSSGSTLADPLRRLECLVADVCSPVRVHYDAHDSHSYSHTRSLAPPPPHSHSHPHSLTRLAWTVRIWVSADSHGRSPF